MLVETKDGQKQIAASLHAFRNLASGNPTWEQMNVDDRLLDLWIDYTAEQADTLSSSALPIMMGIVWGATAFRPRPQESQRVALRRITKGLATTTGWSSLVMELERAWLGEFFAARPARDRMDRRSDQEAEADRLHDASGWSEVAIRAARFVGHPLGAGVRTPSDVVHRLEQILELASRTASPVGISNCPLGAGRMRRDG